VKKIKVDVERWIDRLRQQSAAAQDRKPAKAPTGEFVVVDWGGLDQEEHQAGLPAYELARSSLTVP
jgi:FKBP-type peptidyl-prolyl cis-trans isomerase (trigger factor)